MHIADGMDAMRICVPCGNFCLIYVGVRRNAHPNLQNLRSPLPARHDAYSPWNRHSCDCPALPVLSFLSALLEVWRQELGRQCGRI